MKSTGLFFGTLVVLVICLGAQAEPPAVTPKPGAPEKASPATDLYGDVLPPGAVYRLGTTRFRIGGQSDRAAFSPDGKSVAQAGVPGSLIVWDLSSGKVLRDFAGHLGNCFGAFSLDGKVLASADSGGVVRFWDLNTGKETGKFSTKKDNRAWLARMMFSPDGKVLVTVGGPGDANQICFWSVPGSQRISEITGDKNRVSALAFSPDAKVLASSGFDRKIHLWEMATGKERSQLGGHSLEITHLAFTPDGKTLVAASDHSVHLWDVDEEKEVRQQMDREMTTFIIALSPDGKLLVSGKQDGTFILRDAASMKEIHQMGAKGARTQNAFFSPDCKVLATRGWIESRLRFWDLTSGKELSPASGHRNFIETVAFSSDGKTLASSSWDSVILWDPASGKEIRRIQGDGNGFRGAALAADGKTLATGSGEGIVTIWNPASGMMIRQLQGQREKCFCVALSPDGKTVAAAGIGDRISLWDVASGKELPGCGTKEKQGWIASLAFSPNGKVLGSAAANRVASLWDPLAHIELRQLPNHQGSVMCLAFSPDGKKLVTAGYDRSIRLWSVNSGEEIGQFLADQVHVKSVAFSPDGKKIASGYDGSIRLWDVATKEELCRVTGHQGLVMGLAFSPDGKQLASGAYDTTVVLWDVKKMVEAGAPKIAQLTPKELESLWSDLAGNDARKAYQAVRKLVSARKESIAFLQEHLRPVDKAPDSAQITKLIADLDDDQFAVRELAARQLEALGKLAEPVLRKALTGKPSAEVLQRIEGLLERLKGQGALSDESLRLTRAIEVLERIGTNEARQFLEKLAKGVPEATITEEAKKALERLNKTRK